MNRHHFPPLPISQTADFSGLLMFYACRPAYSALQMPSAANGNTCRDGGYYVHSRDQLSFNILYNACITHYLPSSLYPVSYWNLCVNSNQTIFFHFTLFIQFLGFVSRITAEFKAVRKVVVGIRIDLIFNSNNYNHSCYHNSELNSVRFLSVKPKDFFTFTDLNYSSRILHMLLCLTFLFFHGFFPLLLQYFTFSSLLL